MREREIGIKVYAMSCEMAMIMIFPQVWCYVCDDYVHNEVLIPAKSSAHESKFGMAMPH